MTVSPPDPDRPLALLGGLSPAAFMRRHWHKKPLLIRQAWPGIRSPVTRAELFNLAAGEDAESRLIVRDTPREDSDWTLRHGPIPRRALPKLDRPGWTLLLQGLDLHSEAARAMLDAFRFVPEARLDDLMISYATDGGGVGPHFDSYDVFLLQVHGRRRWRIGRLPHPQLREGVPLKILTNFAPEHEWVLEPGDMLYLPPRWAHDGIAEGECMTCSVGFRSPSAGELAREVLQRLLDDVDADDQPAIYRDPKQPAVSDVGRIPGELQGFAVDAIRRMVEGDPDHLLSSLGRYLSEPKSGVWFEPGVQPLPGQALELDRRSRMLYDDRNIYLNGEAWRAGGADARLMRQLADRRRLEAAQWQRASEAARALLAQWAEDGWLRPAAAGPASTDQR